MHNCCPTLHGLCYHVPPTSLHNTNIDLLDYIVELQAVGALNHVPIFWATKMNLPNCTFRLNQSTASSFHKRIPWYHIWVKYVTVKITEFLQYLSLLHIKDIILHKSISLKNFPLWLHILLKAKLSPKKSTASETSSKMTPHSARYDSQILSHTTSKQNH